MNQLTQIKSIPVEKNCETIACGCGAETVVLQKDYVIEYTCPTCWEMKSYKKRKKY